MKLKKEIARVKKFFKMTAIISSIILVLLELKLVVQGRHADIVNQIFPIGLFIFVFSFVFSFFKVKLFTNRVIKKPIDEITKEDIRFLRQFI